MKLRANLLNMHLVAELPLSKQVSAITGRPSPYVTIFQFCDALTARAMLDDDVDFAAYLPCRIALVEDDKGRGWLVMMDLDMILEPGPPQTRAEGEGHRGPRQAGRHHARRRQRRFVITTTPDDAS